MAWKRRQRSSVDFQDGDFATEVKRISSIGDGCNWRRILGLQPEESMSIQAAKARHRELMLLLHPDKRDFEGERRAGGREIRDHAVSLVHSSLDSARQDLNANEGDEQQEEKLSMRWAHLRIAKLQQEQARAAMRRQEDMEKTIQDSKDAQEAALLQNMSKDIDQVLLPRSLIEVADISNFVCSSPETLGSTDDDNDLDAEERPAKKRRGASRPVTLEAGPKTLTQLANEVTAAPKTLPQQPGDPRQRGTADGTVLSTWIDGRSVLSTSRAAATPLAVKADPDIAFLTSMLDDYEVEPEPALPADPVTAQIMSLLQSRK